MSAKKTAITYFPPSINGSADPATRKSVKGVVFKASLGGKPTSLDSLKRIYGITCASFPTTRPPVDTEVKGSRINLHEKWEVQYWTKVLGVSAEDLQRAVDKVGPSSVAVKAYSRAAFKAKIR